MPMNPDKPHYIERPQIRNLDELPLLDRTLLDYQRYFDTVGISGAKHTMAIYSSRGCPYRCTYCDIPRLNRFHFRRSAESVFEEVKRLASIGVKRFEVMDDIFNVNRRESMKFFRLVVQHKLDVKFFFQVGLRGDLLDRELVDLMVEGGTVYAFAALETASPRLQKMIKKNLDVELFHKNIDYICTHHPQLVLGLFAMYGFPTETEAEAMQTIDLISSLKWIDFPLLMTLRIFPGTEMEEVARAHGVPEHLIQASMQQNSTNHSECNLVFDNDFSLRVRRRLLKEYLLNRERLLAVLPQQMKVFSEEELTQKYRKVLYKEEMGSFYDVLTYARARRNELSTQQCLDAASVQVPDLNRRLEIVFPPRRKDAQALRLMLIDLSSSIEAFDAQGGAEWDQGQPLGLLALGSYLQEQPFAERVRTEIVVSGMDFHRPGELADLVRCRQPDLIGFRVMTLYKKDLHSHVRELRRQGIDTPIIVGGPHATGSHREVLQDSEIALAVVGEGEITLSEIVARALDNGNRLPDPMLLADIPGVMIRGQPLPEAKQARSIAIVAAAGGDAGAGQP